jgi:DNA-binding LytR/AlgR family response regulator
MQLAHREMLRPVMCALAGGMVVYLLVQHTLMGALGTGQVMTWAQRLGFWAAIALLQAPISYASCVLTLYLARRRRPLEIAVALLAMVLILAAPCTAFVMTIFGLVASVPGTELSAAAVYGTCVFNMFWATALLFHVLWIRLNPAGETAAAADTGEAPSVTEAQQSAVQPPAVVSTAPVVHAVAAVEPVPSAHAGMGHYAGTVPAPAAPPIAAAAAAGGEMLAASAAAAAAGSRFFDRLPDDLGRDIIYIAASAHYVDVVTKTGSAAILLRFSDAVAELGSLGLRVHRSYWVAYPHVKRAFRRDGRTMLLLTDNHEVRVGRNYLPEVRAAIPKAWIRARRRRNNQSAPGVQAPTGTSS